MKFNIYSVLCFFLLLISCEKDKDKAIEMPDKKDTISLITRDWHFKETPKKNLNHFQNMIEDRTVFDGTEKITFKLDGSFLVNDTKYGVWEVNKGKTIIKISQVPYNEYTCCGIGQTRMDWEIRTITETEMIVYHQYYTFIDNWYKLE